jgi:hypothetical protein
VTVSESFGDGNGRSTCQRGATHTWKTQQLRKHGQNGLFNMYLTDVTGTLHGSGIGGCENFKQGHGRDLNFFRGKSRISIIVRGTEGILSFGLEGVDF